MGMLGRSITFALLVACGPVTETAAPDAAPQPDALPEIQTIGLVIDSLEIPETNQRVGELALDIDGDGTTDNALGSAVATQAATTGDILGIQEALDAAVAGGVMLSLIELQTHDLTDATGVRARGFIGADGDEPPDPLDNFSGSEMFRIVPGSPTDSDLSGTISDAGLAVGPGSFPLVLALPDTVPIQLDLLGARMEATVEAEGRLSGGRLGGGVTEQQIDQTFIPALAESYQAVVERDCPSNQCVSGSDGETVRDTFDLDGDGVVTAADLRANDLVGAILAPDLDLFDSTGAFNPNSDGVDETTSIGVGFSTTGAVFAAP